jgi:hypothetical protein
MSNGSIVQNGYRRESWFRIDELLPIPKPVAASDEKK